MAKLVYYSPPPRKPGSPVPFWSQGCIALLAHLALAGVLRALSIPPERYPVVTVRFGASLLLAFPILLLITFFALDERWRWRAFFVGGTIGVVVRLVMLLPLLPFALK
jgi:hypothetical protein